MGKKVHNIYWQAHRGGGAYEAPDNTMAAIRYAWDLGGIPEVDVRSTRDGVIICLHDATLERTTNAPDEIKAIPVSELSFSEICSWDAGSKFHEKFTGEKVPSLEEMFREMQGRPERIAYLDLKDVDLRQLGALIDQYHVNSQVIFAHNVQANCKKMKEIAQGVRSMQWIGGTPDNIRSTFAEIIATGFDGLDQVQIHLRSRNGSQDKSKDRSKDKSQDKSEDKAKDDSQEWYYIVDREFLQYALKETEKAGIDLEVLPFEVEAPAIEALLDLGIRWYATDEPARFLECVKQWEAQQQ